MQRCFQTWEINLIRQKSVILGYLNRFIADEPSGSVIIETHKTLRDEVLNACLLHNILIMIFTVSDQSQGQCIITLRLTAWWR